MNPAVCGCHGGRRRVRCAHCPGTMLIPQFLNRCARAYVYHIYNRVPVTAELAYLLRIDIKQQCDFVRVLGGLRLNIRKVDPAARSSRQSMWCRTRSDARQ